VRRLAEKAADQDLLLPTVADRIGRVKGIRRQGVRLGNCLTAPQAEHLLGTPDIRTLKGKRDRALLAVLLGCGLRREEAALLTLEHVRQREGRWVIVDLRGKGQRVRSVPMPSWAKAALDVWRQTAGSLLGVCSGR
jgi:site-specific recombinase XerD